MYISDHQNSMSWRRLVIALVAGFCLVSAARAQSPPVSAATVMNEVVANELTDRVQQRKWLYLIDRRDGKQTLTEQQVDTKDGPIYRVLAIDGIALNQIQRQQDNARMDRLLHDPVLQLKLKVEQEEDETKLEKVLRLMPQAFLYDYDGVEGNLLRIKFRPNNNYNPPTYEARVVHAMAGTVFIDAQHKRLAKFNGRLMDRVEFGYGFLGYIDKGGTIEIGRVQVDASEWKTTFVNIQLSGRLIFFKTISKQEYETRSGFRAVPGNLSLLAASQLLAH
jgi:ribosomal protein L21